MIDTHCHLYADEVYSDIDSIMQNAQMAGVKSFYLPAIDSSHSPTMDALKSQYPKQIHLMAGLHPTHVTPETHEQELAHVLDRLQSGGMVAVGEIGIDLYWDKTYVDLQKQAFAHQIRLAKQFDLPIVIHVREAFDEMFEVLNAESYKGMKGILHCFSGDLYQAQKAIDMGLMLGIGGVITFKNGKIDRFIHQLPLDKLVLETDTPYLAPAPFRGKPNQPAYLTYIVDKLAQAYGTTSKEIMDQTTQNVHQIFEF